MAINKIIYDVSGEEIVDQNGQVTVYGIDGHGHTVNKVEYGQSVLMDITDTTATASDVAFGEYFYSNDGIKRTGTKSDASPINVNPNTASVEDETLTIVGDGTTQYITLYDNEAVIASDNPNYIWINNMPEEINVGDRYRITWNNTTYTKTAVYDTVIGPSYGNVIGNPSILNGTDDGSNVPFCAFKYPSDDNVMVISTTGSGTITLKIEKIVIGGNASLGTKTITQNGTYNASSDNLDGYSEVTVNVASTSKNVQIANGVNRVATTDYTAISGQTLTVAETGKYDVYWSGYRSSTSGTSGSQLYIDDIAYGSANTTFSNNGQSVHLSNVSLTKNQVIAVRARARNTSYYMYVSNLTIIQS